MGVTVHGVQECFGVLGAGVPARVQEQPASFGEWSVVVLEGAYVIDGEQVVGVSGCFCGTVDHDRGGDEVAGRHLPGAGTCLTQALAAEVLLRRQGYPSLLHIGVLRGEEGQLEAHAWLKSGDKVVIGGGELERYTPLALLEGEKQ